MKGFSFFCLLACLAFVSCVDDQLTYFGLDTMCRCTNLSDSNTLKAAAKYNCKIIFLTEDVNKLATDEIVPDLIPELPQYKVEVEFEGSEVLFGNELKPTQTIDVPVAMSWPVTEDALYTIAMVDPDAGDPKVVQFVHWLVVNAPGCDIMSGETSVEYLGPEPPADAVHRMVFLIYLQKEKLSLDTPVITIKGGGDRHSSIQKLVEKHQLELVAGNYFQSHL